MAANMTGMASVAALWGCLCIAANAYIELQAIVAGEEFGATVNSEVTGAPECDRDQKVVEQKTDAL